MPWLVIGDVESTGEMRDGSALYVAFKEQQGNWVQVFYPLSALTKLADLEEGDSFSTACVITGVDYPTDESNYWRVGCLPRDAE